MFLTLTAPSFGPVHSRRARRGRETAALPAAPRRRDVPARREPRLLARSTTRAIRVSASRCARECFDYEHAVLWNAMAPELWRRTSIQLPRELARLTGVSVKRLRKRVRVSYVKVAEYQRRGALHFHVLIRLDAAQPKDRAELVEAPPAEYDAELLTQAALAAVEHVSVTSPTPDGNGTERARDPVGPPDRDPADPGRQTERGRRRPRRHTSPSTRPRAPRLSAG